MPEKLLAHVRGNVVGYIALFVALGGTSYAAVEISGRDVRNGSLTGADIRDGSLTGRDVRSRSIGAGDLTAAAKGPKGDTGPQGPAGPAGAPGSDATVDTSAFVRRGAVSTVTAESDIAVPPNSTTTAGTLSCPAGDVPARGRYALTGDPAADDVTESLDGKAYVVKVANPTAQTQFAHVKLGLACADLDVPAPPLP